MNNNNNNNNNNKNKNKNKKKNMASLACNQAGKSPDVQSYFKRHGAKNNFGTLRKFLTGDFFYNFANFPQC